MIVFSPTDYLREVLTLSDLSDPLLKHLKGLILRLVIATLKRRRGLLVSLITVSLLMDVTSRFE